MIEPRRSAQSSGARLLVIGGLLAFSSIFQMGYSNAYPNTSIDSFRVYLNESYVGGVDEASFTWLWSLVLNVWFVGFAAGSWMAVPVADRLGRKWCLLLGNSLNFLGALLSLLSIPLRLWWLFTLGRLIYSVASAFSMNSLILLLQESAPSAMRGTMSFYAEMSFVLTNAIGCLCGMKAVLGENLEWLLGVVLFPTFLSVVVVLPIHESPRYLLLTRKDKEAATDSLKFYQQTDDEACEGMLEDVARESASHSQSEGGERKKSADGESISHLWNVPHFRKGLLLGVLSMQLTCSVWPVIFLSTEFLRRANVELETAETMSTLMLFISSLSTVVGMVLVERFSRRRLFLLFSSINVGALCLFVLGASFQPWEDRAKFACMAALVLHGISYSLALGPIAWFLTAELLPLSLRASGQSIALSANQIVALLLSFVTLPAYDLLESYGMSGSLSLIPLYVLPGAGAVIVLYVYLPETRGVEIAEVICQLQKSPRKIAAQRETVEFELKNRRI